ncbi:8519_t:CDS:1, partial [Funneliformis geosporum]
DDPLDRSGIKENDNTEIPDNLIPKMFEESYFLCKVLHEKNGEG